MFVNAVNLEQRLALDGRLACKSSVIYITTFQCADVSIHTAVSCPSNAEIGSTGQTGRKQRKGRRAENLLYLCVFEAMSLKDQRFAKLWVGQIPPSPP